MAFRSQGSVAEFSRHSLRRGSKSKARPKDQDHMATLYSLPGSDCGVPDVSPLVFNRIVGGTEAEPHSWPWIVSLTHRRREWRHQCGGSVISHRWVITAAHCMYVSYVFCAMSPVSVRRSLTSRVMATSIGKCRFNLCSSI